MKKRALIVFAIFVLPWRLRRFLLQKLLGYQIAPSAFISRMALIIPDELVMGENAVIDSFSTAIHLHRLEMGESALIGRSNWISGFPKGSDLHFVHLAERDPSLFIGQHSAITKQHIIDCTETIRIGDFTTIAGYRSQFLTHSLDYVECRQDASPITIGDYCIVGTGSIFLPGSQLPNYSICGAGSVVNKRLAEEYSLYAGSPAVHKKTLAQDARYFSRLTGFIY